MLEQLQNTAYLLQKKEPTYVMSHLRLYLRGDPLSQVLTLTDCTHKLKGHQGRVAVHLFLKPTIILASNSNRVRIITVTGSEEHFKPEPQQ